MPRRDIQLCTGEFYHLYNRGHNRERIFFERENYLFFLQRLRQHLLPVLDVVAYCLMPTHYHLLVQIKTSEVSQTSEVSVVAKAMMRLSVSYTKAMNKRYDRVGALFQGAFQAKRVDSDAYLAHLSRYIHLNPMLAGYGASPEEWEFSSYAEYLGLRHGSLPVPDIVLAQFPTRKAYQAFVEEYNPAEQERIASLLFD
jgi:REP element-mobilizing transposase RayT